MECSKLSFLLHGMKNQVIILVAVVCQGMLQLCCKRCVNKTCAFSLSEPFLLFVHEAQITMMSGVGVLPGMGSSPAPLGLFAIVGSH